MFPQFQHFNPYSQHNHSVSNPGCPWEGEIPNGMQPGKQIHINGVVPHHANRFQIDLKTNHGTALHINPRFDQNAMVRNTEVHGGWQHEERHGPLIFERGQMFNMVIEAMADRFHVTVNNHHAFDYNHRVPLHEVNRLGLVGDIQVHQITFTSGGRGGHENGPLHVPGTVAIRQGVQPGRLIQIQGVPHPNAGRFVINLQSSGQNEPPTIPMHFSVRWNDPHSPHSPVVVRTNCSHNSWGAEERDLQATPFPFHKGTPFDMLILIEQHEIKVAVNGHHFVSFRHRAMLEEINHVGVTGDVTIQNVKIF